MLLLPNRENAFIQPEKLTGYLLSETHSVGKSKAKFFCELGFNEENVDILEQELLKVANFQEITETITTKHGTKYVIIGIIRI
jgi:N-acetylglutamate synthase-like GNAT family acetyltransferase